MKVNRVVAPIAVTGLRGSLCAGCGLISCVPVRCRRRWNWTSNSTNSPSPVCPCATPSRPHRQLERLGIRVPWEETKFFADRQRSSDRPSGGKRDHPDLGPAGTGNPPRARAPARLAPARPSRCPTRGHQLNQHLEKIALMTGAQYALRHSDKSQQQPKAK